MRRRLLSMLAAALFIPVTGAQAQSIPTGGLSLNFDDPLTASPSKGVGGSCVYNDVIVIDGTPYDAIITIDNITNGLISDFDATTSTNGNTAANFSPSVLWTGAGEISYRLEFIEDGTASAPVLARLGGISLTAWDLDGIGAPGKYLESSSFTSYTLGSSSVVTFASAGTNAGRFSNANSSANTVGNDGTSRASLAYASAASISFSIGSSGAGSWTQMLSLSSPTNWFPTTAATTAIPTIYTFGTTAPYFTCSGSASAGQSIAIEGYHLSDSLIVTAPAGYAVSAAANGTYTNSLTLGADSLGHLDTAVFIAMDGSAPATNPAQITLSSSGATDVLIAVSGTTGGTLTVSNFTKTDPTACATEDGTISFSIANVPDGTYTVTYMGGSTTAAVTSGVATLTNLAEGPYIDLQLTDANGCTSAAGNSLTLNEPIDFTIAFAPSDQNVCTNATATFGVFAAGTTTVVQWSSFDGTAWSGILGATNNTFTTPALTDTARYQVTVTSAAGCRWTSPMATVTVNSDPVATLTSTPASCPGTTDGTIDLTMVTAATPMSFSWSNGASTEDLTNVASGSYTVTLLDPIGCQGTATIAVSDSDGVAPTVYAKDITVQLDSMGLATITAADVDSASSDNCNLTLSIDSASWDCSGLGAHTVMLVGTDGALSDTAYATVTVVDTIAPALVCAGDTTLYVAADTSGTAYSWTALVATDVCGIDTTYATDTSGSWFEIGTHEMWSYATDANGNSDSCLFQITVLDTLAPMFSSCPLDTVLYASALNCGANLNWTAPTATDNSDSVTYTHSDTSGTFFPVGIDTVFHYAFDPSGNTDTCFFVVTVRDTIAPTWDGTLDTLAVFAGADTCGIFTDSLTLTPPTIVEACGLDTLFHSAAAYYALGEYDIYWYATDLSGNTDSILQRLVVTENIKPELYCPSDSITIYADNDSTWTQVSWTGDSIYDNCGVDSAYFNLASGSYLQIGIFKIDYFGYDLSGNGDICSFFLSVVDTTAPVINLAQGDTTLLADPDSCFASFAWTAPTIDENSTNYSTAYYNSNTPSGNFALGTTVIAYAVTDAAGYSDSAFFTITVVDGSGPALLAQNAFLTLDAMGFDTLSVADVDTGSYDCNGIDSLWLSEYVFTCQNIGSNSIWFYGLDTLGNLDSTAITVTVGTGPNGVIQATTATTDALCFGQANGTASLTAVGGAGPYTYTWTTLDTTANIGNLLAGTYFYDVSDSNGCVASGSITIGEPASMAISTIVSNYNGYGVSAEGATDGTIDLTVTGGVQPMTYDWNNGYATTEDLAGLAEGLYFVIATDSNGCSVTDTVVLTEPDYFDAEATALSNNICPNESNGSVYVAYSGGVAPITLSWSTGAATDTLTGLTSGWYFITAVDANGVLATDSIEVLAEDLDCDGILNIDEGGTPGGGGGLADQDGDGIPNQEDTDSDGDGIGDAYEFDSNGDGIGFDDCDNDGLPDFLDSDECTLDAATVLTPDNDGNNDFWTIPGIENFPGSHVALFNRLGLKVYENVNYENDFDGRANVATYLNNAEAILPTGTYFYYIRMGGSSTREYNGYLYINR
ncbi:HYR domain-containing protein [Schleiferiaceae bacterium]|nr:HYR domain-containing protein [Schleiferiaceae bacterium]